MEPVGRTTNIDHLTIPTNQAPILIPTHRRQIRIALLFGPHQFSRHEIILGLHMLGKCQVLQRILMSAKHLRIVRQLRQFAHQRVVHLLRRTLEEPPATGQKQRITRENAPSRAVGRLHEIANVSGRMARREQAAHIQAAHFEHIVVAHLMRQRTDAIVAAVHRQLAPIVGGGKQFAQLLVAAGMVPMVVGGQNGRQLDVESLDGCEHCGRIDGINDGRLFGVVVDELSV